MNKEYSIYLDFVRFFAAFIVMLYHTNGLPVYDPSIESYNVGHTAVMIFFVLSGYVITYVADQKEKTLKVFAIARMSRIYSVALPAVLLTPILDLIGYALAPEFYAGRTGFDLWYIRIISSLAFMNELWFLSIMSFSNVPYWSLNYEIWYYVIFGLAHYLSGKKRVLLITLTLLLIGPKILLLAPIWYAGVFIYKSKRLNNINEFTGLVLFITSLILLYFYHSYNLTEVISKLVSAQSEVAYKYLAFSRYFLFDYFLAAIICMNFVGIKACAHLFRKLFISIEKPVRYLAAHTFVLYLFHDPLRFFWASIYQGDKTSSLYFWQVIMSIFVSILLLGYLTERQKNRYKIAFEYIFSKCAFKVKNT